MREVCHCSGSRRVRLCIEKTDKIAASGREGRTLSIVDASLNDEQLLG